MKKIFLVAVAIFAFASMGHAQIKFGAKGGLNIANQNFEFEGFSISPDSKIGFHIGAMAKAAISEKVSIMPELLYSTEGSSTDDGDFEVNYINLPILVAFNPSEMFNIHAGPQLGYLISADADGDIKDELKSINLSLAIGAAVELSNGFTGGVRYNLGLSNIADSEEFFGDGELKNNTFQIYVGYWFGN
jgi:hypothetical protein